MPKKGTYHAIIENIVVRPLRWTSNIRLTGPRIASQAHLSRKHNSPKRRCSHSDLGSGSERPEYAIRDA
jgi:hypothetical protein